MDLSAPPGPARENPSKSGDPERGRATDALHRKGHDGPSQACAPGRAFFRIGPSSDGRNFRALRGNEPDRTDTLDRRAGSPSLPQYLQPGIPLEKWTSD